MPAACLTSVLPMLPIVCRWSMALLRISMPAHRHLGHFAVHRGLNAMLSPSREEDEKKPEKGDNAKITFVHFFVKKVTKVIFVSSKNRDIFDQGHPRLQISPNNAWMSNLLYIIKFGDM